MYQVQLARICAQTALTMFRAGMNPAARARLMTMLPPAGRSALVRIGTVGAGRLLAAAKSLTSARALGAAGLATGLISFLVGREDGPDSLAELDSSTPGGLASFFGRGEAGVTDLVIKLKPGIDKEDARALAKILSTGIDVAEGAEQRKAALAASPQVAQGRDNPFTTQGSFDRDRQAMAAAGGQSVPRQQLAAGAHAMSFQAAIAAREEIDKYVRALDILARVYGYSGDPAKVHDILTAGQLYATLSPGDRALVEQEYERQRTRRR